MIAHAFEQLAPEVEASRKESEALYAKKDKERQEKQDLLEKGGYSNFRHANQIKV